MSELCQDEGCEHHGTPHVCEAPAPAAAELVPLTIGYWDAQLRTVMGLAKEVSDSLTTRERLRTIAKMCIVQLIMLFEAAKADEERVAADAQQQEPAPQIVVPDSQIILL